MFKKIDYFYGNNVLGILLSPNCELFGVKGYVGFVASLRRVLPVINHRSPPDEALADYEGGSR